MAARLQAESAFPLKLSLPNTGSIPLTLPAGNFVIQVFKLRRERGPKAYAIIKQTCFYGLCRLLYMPH
jgi:hypothetical protein